MSVKNEVVVNKKQYELVPPDGGWGYMIWISAMIVCSTTSMFLGCFGMIYKDFLITLGMGSTSVTLLNGLNVMSLSIAGYFTSPLLKMMGLRKLAFMAAFLFSSGSFCTVFVNSTIPFFICLGPMQCTGFGILYNLTTSQMNDYFLKKRFLSISFVQTISALAAMVAPQIIRWSMDFYGFRGTLILISAISIQNFVAAALMQPVEKHLVKVEKIESSENEIKILLDDSKENEKITATIIALKNSEKPVDVKHRVTRVNFRLVIEKVVDASVLKKYLKSAAAMGATYCFFIEGLFILWVPQALYAMQWSKDEVAQGVMLAGFGDLVTRIVFTFSSKWLMRLGSHEIYITGLMVAFLSILGMLWSNRIPIIMVFLTMTGIARCTICILPPLILSDLFEPQQFTSVIGIYMMLIGIMNLILGPAFGAIRDLTDSYPTVFYMIASCFAIVIICWSIELCYKRSKQKRLLRKEQVEMLQKQRLRKQGRKS